MHTKVPASFLAGYCTYLETSSWEQAAQAMGLRDPEMARRIVSAFTSQPRVITWPRSKQ